MEEESQGGQVTSESSKHLRNCQSFQIHMSTDSSVVFIQGRRLGERLGDNSMLKCKDGEGGEGGEDGEIWWISHSFEETCSLKRHHI